MIIKKLHLSLKIVFLSFGIGWAQDAGVPTWLWCATYAIENLPGQSQLPCSIENADRFYSRLQHYANQFYPSISVQRTFNRPESEVTKYAFAQSGEASNSEIIFINSHGHDNFVQCWDDYAYLSDMFFSNYTKWIFINSCRTLHTDYTTLYSTMENFFSHGAHAVFGYASKSYWLQEQWRCGFLWLNWCYDCRDRYMYDNLFYNWIQLNMGLTNAYFEAGLRQYQETGYAHEMVVWSSTAYSYTLGKRIWGGTEDIDEVYYGGMSPDYGLMRHSAIIPDGGSPVY
jgi:hypothetical protein